MYKTRNTGTGNGIRGTRGMGEMLYSGECCRTLRGMSPMFGLNEGNYWADSHLESHQTSTMKLLFVIFIEKEISFVRKAIKSSCTVELLGITLDKNLNFKSHIENLCSLSNSIFSYT